MGESFNGFRVIEINNTPPLARYGYPEFCRHCGQKLNPYNPFDACYSCQESDKQGFPREKEIQQELRER